MPGAEPQKLKIYLNGERAPGMLCPCCGKLRTETFFYTPELGVICGKCWVVKWGVYSSRSIGIPKDVAQLFEILEYQFDNEEVRNNILDSMIKIAQRGEDMAKENLRTIEYNRVIHEKYYSKEKPNATA